MQIPNQRLWSEEVKHPILVDTVFFILQRSNSIQITNQMPMTSVMMSLGTGSRKCTSKQNVLKSRSWLWMQKVMVMLLLSDISSVESPSLFVSSLN